MNAFLSISSFQTQSTESLKVLGLEWWAWILILLAVIIIVAILWWISKSDDEDEVTEVAESQPKDLTQADDLTKIEGIGPKINELFQKSGLRTFADLASVSVEDLQMILDEADIHIAKPDTWPEQAALAANAKWDELQKLQDELVGGRKE